MNLNDVLNDEAKRASITEDVCRLVDEEVGNQRGISGVAVKAGYKLVQGGFERGMFETVSYDEIVKSPQGEPILNGAMGVDKPKVVDGVETMCLRFISI